jgi:hypothetical protein
MPWVRSEITPEGNPVDLSLAERVSRVSATDGASHKINSAFCL